METLSLDRFLLQLPNLLLVGIPKAPIPPLSILNEALLAGTDDAGMGGGVKWEPFAIEPREYVETIATLRQRGTYLLDPPPRSVVTLKDWYAWRTGTFYDWHVQRPPRADHRERDSRDDALMRIAKALSDARLANDAEAADAGERALEEFLR